MTPFTAQAPSASQAPCQLHNPAAPWPRSALTSVLSESSLPSSSSSSSLPGSCCRPRWLLVPSGSSMLMVVASGLAASRLAASANSASKHGAGRALRGCPHPAPLPGPRVLPPPPLTWELEPVRRRHAAPAEPPPGPQPPLRALKGAAHAAPRRPMGGRAARLSSPAPRAPEEARGAGRPIGGAAALPLPAPPAPLKGPRPCPEGRVGGGAGGWKRGGGGKGGAARVAVWGGT